MKYTSEALGQIIRESREGLPTNVSQQDLGEEASYGRGAGVSISRIEAGQTLPTKAKLEGIARALNLTVAELEDRATERTKNLAITRGSSTSSSQNPATPKERAIAVESETQARVDLIEQLSVTYETAHNRARDEYFLPFIEWAPNIEGARTLSIPEVHPKTRTSNGNRYEQGAIVEVSSRSADLLKAIASGLVGTITGAASGGASAYATYTNTELFSKASTGAPISSLTGVARRNATLAVVGGGTVASGGGGIAAGTTVLTAVVAVPAIIGSVAASAYFLHRRSKAQEAKLVSQLDSAEALLKQTQAGFDLLAEYLPKATETLDYIAIHAAHAFRRWTDSFTNTPMNWDSLTEAQKQRFDAFVEIAACEVSIDAIDTTQFLTAEEEQLDDYAAASEATLRHADTRVRTLV